MNIGIDIDDTITNTFDFLMPYIAEHFKFDIKYLRENNISYMNLDEKITEEQYHDFGVKYFDKVIPNTPIKENVCEYINKLKDIGHKIYIITARVNGEYTDAYKTSIEFLEKNNIYYDKLICDEHKAKVCQEENIDIMIDDSIDNCTAIKNIGKKVLLFNSKYNSKFNVDFDRVDNWKQAFEYIKGM